LREENSLIFVGFNLPLVPGMRFAYIEGEEFESIAEAAVKLPEVPNPGHGKVVRCSCGKLKLPSQGESFRIFHKKVLLVDNDETINN
jgi:hypothetical protein